MDRYGLRDTFIEFHVSQGHRSMHPHVEPNTSILWIVFRHYEGSVYLVQSEATMAEIGMQLSKLTGLERIVIESKDAKWRLTPPSARWSYVDHWPETTRDKVVCVRSRDAETAALRARELGGEQAGEQDRTCRGERR